MADRTLRELIVDIARDLPAGALDSTCRALETLGADLAVADALASVNVGNPDARKTLAALGAAWTRESGGGPPSALAWALRGAAATDDRWRDESALDLVWTGPMPAAGKVRMTRQVLQEIVDSAEHDLWLLCFTGYRIPEIAAAFEAALDRGVRIRVIQEEAGGSGGKLTLSGMKALGPRVAEKAEAYVWPKHTRPVDDKGEAIGSLHAKGLLADDKRLFITSANLTGHALDVNMELGVLIRGGSRPKWMAEHLRWLIDAGPLERVA